jgi:branched-chain amino acid transport system ATP-binding protein
MTALAVDNLAKSFAGFHAVKGVSFSVAAGERRAIIGPNGAGKSTLFNLIGGQARPTAGRVSIDGRDVTGAAPYRMWRSGLTRTFQRNQLFPTLSVCDNMRLAIIAARRLGHRAFSRMSRFASVDDDVAAVLAKVRLADRAEVAVHDLAYGEQRQLELGLALAGNPKILLLDEPTAGMSPAETTAMMALLQELPRSITLLIVEHDMDVVFALADLITVLHLGEVLAEGDAAAIQSHPAVLAVYLGQQAGAA